MSNIWLNPVIEFYVKHFGRPEKVRVWDVGSRDGRDGVEIAVRLGGSEKDVVCVEANPEQAAVIRDSFPFVKVHQFAAYNEAGTADFVVYRGDAGAVGSSSLNLTWKGDDLESKIITVPTVRLDSVIGDETIDVMKIDVEGKSPEVLEGLGDKLAQVKLLHIETEEWSGSDKWVEEYMGSRGFLLVHVDEQYGQMPDQVWINGRFV